MKRMVDSIHFKNQSKFKLKCEGLIFFHNKDKGHLCMSFPAYQCMWTYAWHTLIFSEFMGGRKYDYTLLHTMLLHAHTYAHAYMPAHVQILSITFGNLHTHIKGLDRRCVRCQDRACSAFQTTFFHALSCAYMSMCDCHRLYTSL